MSDFALAALPFVAAGVSLAVAAVRFPGRKKEGKKGGGTADDSMEGMCIGMCIGTMIGPCFPEYMGICLSAGALGGLLIGMCIKKKGNQERD